MKRNVLSGMRPTGNLHLGNYFGAIVQFLELQASGDDCYFFVADVHALTEVNGPTEVDALSIEVAKNYLACGVDPVRCALYRQSDVPEVSEIAILLANVAKVGRLRNCTTFKDRLHNRGVSEGEVSLGLLAYPVLMAADILAVGAHRVPVGLDQTQHVEMARDFARSFNHVFGAEVFTIPEMHLRTAPRVPGIDGAEKMGKSDGNTIALLDDEAVVLKKVLQIPTQAESGGEMEPGTRALFQLAELCSPPDVHADFLRRYHAGERFFGDMKRRLAADISALLRPIQERYHALEDEEVRDTLILGAERVRPVARDVLRAMQHAMGLKPRLA